MTPRGLGPDAPQWRKDAHDQLVTLLTEAFHRAGGDPHGGGELSMRKLAKLCNCSTSTVSRAFTGKALPSRSVLKQLVDELGRRGGLGPLEARRILSLHDQITTGRAFNLAMAVVDGPVPLASGAVAGLTVCSTCGAVVADERQHNSWHWQSGHFASSPDAPAASVRLLTGSEPGTRTRHRPHQQP